MLTFYVRKRYDLAFEGQHQRLYKSVCVIIIVFKELDKTHLLRGNSTKSIQDNSLFQKYMAIIYIFDCQLKNALIYNDDSLDFALKSKP